MVKYSFGGGESRTTAGHVTQNFVLLLGITLVLAVVTLALGAGFIQALAWESWKQISAIFWAAFGILLMWMNEHTGPQVGGQEP